MSNFIIGASVVFAYIIAVQIRLHGWRCLISRKKEAYAFLNEKNDINNPVKNTRIGGNLYRTYTYGGPVYIYN